MRADHGALAIAGMPAPIPAPSRHETASAMAARCAFGASSACCGAIAFAWHDPWTWQNVSELWPLPFGTPIGLCLMTAEFAGGAALCNPRSARPAAATLMLIYALFTVISAFALTETWLAYFGLFEQLCAFCGAAAVFTAGSNTARPDSRIRALRWGIAACVLAFMSGHILWFQHTVELVPGWIPPGQNFWAVATAFAFGCAALGLVLNRCAQLALSLLVAMMGSFIVLIWLPRLAAGQWSLENLAEFAFSCLMTSAIAVVRDAQLKVREALPP